ncbi:MAG: alanine racemase [Oscillospiraceae bacterium]
MMNESILSKIQTPCVVIDMDKAKKNIKEMQDAANEAGCKLRPHIKTHKMQRFAKMQVEQGACGVTCAKVSEAEVMADGGIHDIFIAYPLVGEFRIQRAIALKARVKRLILAVDSIDCARILSQVAIENNLVFEVRLEVDTGAKRTGVLREDAAKLAQLISKLEGLQLTGIYTFKSLVYKDKPTKDKNIAAVEEGEMMKQIAQSIRATGVELEDISAGSSPTGVGVAQTGMVDEIRPGTYIFNDYMLVCEGVCEVEDIAVRMYATVVSTPCDEYAVIDGGTKTFPMDIMLNQEPYFYKGYALVANNDDLRLTRMNEEHGILTSVKGKTELKVGQKLELIPIHVCTAINMQNEVYIYENEDVTLQKVDARGMLV